MNVKSVSDYRTTSIEKLLKHNLFQTERFFLDVYCLKPGQAQTAHTHTDADKVYIVLDGRCSFTVGTESAEHGVGAAVHCPAGEPHGVLNPGPEDARLLVLMAPPPRKGGIALQ